LQNEFSSWVNTKPLAASAKSIAIRYKKKSNFWRIALRKKTKPEKTILLL